MRRFFIARERMARSNPFLDGEEARHLIRVLRKKPGDRIVLFDDSDREFLARIASVDENKVFVEVLEECRVSRESPLFLTLGMPWIRPQPLEWMLQKGTELGVNAFRPFFSDYSRIRGEGRDFTSRLDRFRRILRESAKQCGRNRLPELHPPVGLAELFEGAPEGLKVIPYEGEKNRTLISCVQGLSSLSAATIIIGPEGGFSEKEMASAAAKGFVSVFVGSKDPTFGDSGLGFGRIRPVSLGGHGG